KVQALRGPGPPRPWPEASQLGEPHEPAVDAEVRPAPPAAQQVHRVAEHSPLIVLTSPDGAAADRHQAGLHRTDSRIRERSPHLHGQSFIRACAGINYSEHGPFRIVAVLVAQITDEAVRAVEYRRP